MHKLYFIYSQRFRHNPMERATHNICNFLEKCENFVKTIEVTGMFIAVVGFSSVL